MRADTQEHACLMNLLIELVHEVTLSGLERIGAPLP